MSTNNTDNLFIDKKMLIDMSFNLSHFVVATLLVICLKRFNPILLLILLSLILSYICYSEQANIPIYILPVLGILLYILDLIVISNNMNDVDTTWCQIIKTSLWKLPYLGILSYYTRMLV